MDTLKSGALAWYESLQGWLPCKVLAMPDRDHITVRFTTDHRPFKRGSEFTTTILHVVPRNSLHSRGSYGLSKWISRFTVECDAPVMASH